MTEPRWFLNFTFHNVSMIKEMLDLQYDLNHIEDRNIISVMLLAMNIHHLYMIRAVS